jgi:hypothetical protein
MRQDGRDGRPGSRGLATCGYNAGRRTREALTAAAAARDQTAAQSAAETAAQTQAKVGTHTDETVGDSPTPNPEPEGTHRPGGSSMAARPLELKRDESAPLPVPAPTSSSSMVDRQLISRRDESIPLPRKMDEEIASEVNRALVQQQAPADVRIMNAKRNAKGTITAITNQNATAEMALLYRDIIIKAARLVDKGIIDVEGNESWERLKIHSVPLLRYMGKGAERLSKMRKAIQADSEGLAIPAQVSWLSNPRIIREREQRGEIKASLVVFIVRGKKVALRLVNKGVIAAGVQCKVEPYTNVGPDRLCELCCGLNHRESKCSHLQPKCGYCA